MSDTQSIYDGADAPTCSEALPAGTVLLNGQYTIERYLSNGGFGITYFARDSLDRRVVVKECYPEAFCSRENKTVLARSRSHLKEFRSFVEMFIREAHSIAKLKHPNIVGVHQVFEDNETAYMALDLIDGKDLLETIELGERHLSPQEVKSLLMKVLDAVSTVHEQDMLHRDISPDNILIDAWENPILIDFGAAREEASKKSRALSAVLVVKDGYSPQEFYIAGSQQTPCSDLYALAATFYHLISGQAPPNSQIRLAAIASNKPDPCLPLAGRVDGYAPEFLEAIDKTMSVFPQDRIQSAHDWILQIDGRQRQEAALEEAQKDKEIENTVMQLIIDTQHEAEPVAEKKTPRPMPAPVKKKPRKPEVLSREEVVPTRLVGDTSLPLPLPPPLPPPMPPPPSLPPPMRRIRLSRDFALDAETDAGGGTLVDAAPTKARKRPIKRKMAMAVLYASLALFILDGQTAKFAQVIGPLVERGMTLPSDGIDGFG